MPNVFKLVPVWSVVGWVIGLNAIAGDPTALNRQLDELQSAIKSSREISVRQDSTLDELRKDLYGAAVATRDAKRLSDDIDQLRAKGLLVDVELAQIRGDILSAGVLLRDLRDRIELLAQISQTSQTLLDAQEDEINRLRNAIVDPSKAIESAGEELITSLQRQLDALRLQVTEKDKSIERLTRENRALKSTTRPAAPIVSTVAAQGYDASLAQAFDQLAAGKVEEASLSFKRALTQNPESEDARTGLAACHFERGELDVARRLVDEVLEVNDKNARALGLRGALAYRNGDLRDARRILERAIKSDKENAYNLNYLGIVLHSLGRQEAAIKNIQKAVDLDPDYVSALYNLSILLATDRRPDLEKAQAFYERALALGSPRNPGLDQLFNLTTP